MKRMLINATQKEELRVALVDGQRLYDLDIEIPGQEKKKSNIYKGKITRIEPSLEAVFVDYGLEKHGFLPLKEISHSYLSQDYSLDSNFNIKNFLKEGQEIIVQIDKEERGNKGAALTTFISLAGSYLVLMPNNNKTIGISKRITGLDRIKLKEIILSLSIPQNMGIIIRTAGLNKSIEILQWDLNFRLQLWNSIQDLAKINSSPILLHQESNIILRSFRDYLRQDIGEIIIDNPKILEFAYQYIHLLGRLDFSSKIKLYKGSIPLFSYYQIESQISSAFKREVRLPSGGEIVVDNTEALTAIDVNSSRSTKGLDIEETAFNTNLEAVYEIARQLRLRDLGGLIVIDFIDMTLFQNQKSIENKLREIVKHDRARIQISDISRFGLLEMSRQRLRPSLGESSYHVCSRCSGTGSIRDNESLSLSILRLIEEEAIKENTYAVHAIVPIEIACYLLNEKRSEVNNIEKRQLGGRTIIVPSKHIETPNYSITRIRKGENIKKISYNLSKLYYHKQNSYSTQSMLEKKQQQYQMFSDKTISNMQFNIKKNFFKIKYQKIIKQFFGIQNIIFKNKIIKKILLLFNNILFFNIKKIKNKNIEKHKKYLLHKFNWKKIIFFKSKKQYQNKNLIIQSNQKNPFKIHAKIFDLNDVQKINYINNFEKNNFYKKILKNKYFSLEKNYNILKYLNTLKEYNLFLIAHKKKYFKKNNILKSKQLQLVTKNNGFPLLINSSIVSKKLKIKKINQKRNYNNINSINIIFNQFNLLKNILLNIRYENKNYYKKQLKKVISSSMLSVLSPEQKLALTLIQYPQLSFIKSCLKNNLDCISLLILLEIYYYQINLVLKKIKNSVIQKKTNLILSNKKIIKNNGYQKNFFQPLINNNKKKLFFLNNYPVNHCNRLNFIKKNSNKSILSISKKKCFKKIKKKEQSSAPVTKISFYMQNKKLYIHQIKSYSILINKKYRAAGGHVAKNRSSSPIFKI
ncbi:Ribonuclease E [Buchnera aphidicola (Eriosoma grossulariae)]|uniref:ribonuclease E n=1 Tax=Buchnera aphidicola TaxID=9 RepID=UPI0034639033